LSVLTSAGGLRDDTHAGAHTWEGTWRLAGFLDRLSRVHGVRIHLAEGELTPHSGILGVIRPITVAGAAISIEVRPEPGGQSDAEGVADLVEEMVRLDGASRQELDELSAEIADKYEELNLLYELAEALSRLGDEREICGHVLREAVRIIGGERSGIFLRERESGDLVVAAHHNLDDVAEGFRMAPGEGLLGSVARTGKLLHLEGANPPPGVRIENDGSWIDRQAASPPLVAVPLLVPGGTLGVLLLTHKAFDRSFTSRDVKLARAIAAHAALFIENSRNLERMRATARVQKEMEIARAIQQGLVPRLEPIVPGLDVAGKCRPAADVGGSYFGYFGDSPGTTGVALVDVSGHCVAAAVVAAGIRGVLSCQTSASRSTREVVSRVNALVGRDLEEGGMYATLFYGIYDHASSQLNYTNAGHPPAILSRRGEGRFRRLEAGGPGIGGLDAPAFREETVSLAEGDVLAIHSASLTEARSLSGESFGEERLARALDRYRTGSAWEILTSLLGEVDAFVGGARRADDITLVVMRSTGRQAGIRDPMESSA
jgi:serine phosphatase RsbU (regulator of sigma subunit)